MNWVCEHTRPRVWSRKEVFSFVVLTWTSILIKKLDQYVILKLLFFLFSYIVMKYLPCQLNKSLSVRRIVNTKTVVVSMAEMTQESIQRPHCARPSVLWQKYYIITQFSKTHLLISINSNPGHVTLFVKSKLTSSCIMPISIFEYIRM